MGIASNLEMIRDNIEKTALKVDKKPESITLIGVTKTIDEDRINEAIALGVDNIGENKVQEIQSKYENISGNPKWHMIGHLQSNKVKYIVDKVDLIHSLDRMSLAKEIQKRAEQSDVTVDVLLQVNVAEEESKFGLRVEEIDDFAEKLSGFKNIKVRGLMTIAPCGDDEESLRAIFKTMKRLFEDLKQKDYSNYDIEYLSMGMTNDYMVAIEEGANMVRVGTGIFGQRNYSK